MPELRNLTRDEQRTIRTQGAMVVSVRRGSMVAGTNMQPGFVITSVNGNSIADAAEAITAIQSAYNAIVLDGYYENIPDLYSYRFKKNDD